MKSATLIILIIISLFSTLKAQTEASLNFSIKTLAKTSSKYSPRHVLAIWVEDTSGTLVKNLQLNANKRVQHLYTWNKKSGGNATDITSGATLSSHANHSKTWDCKNKSGELIADGEYKIITEFTSEHAQGPINTVSFNKLPQGITLNPASSSYFSDISLVYTPASTTGILRTETDYSLEAYPNPVTDKMNIMFTLGRDVQITLSIYNMNMKLLKTIYKSSATAGKNEFIWVPSANMANGSYILILQSDNFLATRKIIIAR